MTDSSKKLRLRVFVYVRHFVGLQTGWKGSRQGLTYPHSISSVRCGLCYHSTRLVSGRALVHIEEQSPLSLSRDSTCTSPSRRWPQVYHLPPRLRCATAVSKFVADTVRCCVQARVAPHNIRPAVSGSMNRKTETTFQVHVASAVSVVARCPLEAPKCEEPTAVELVRAAAPP